ncbi:MAG: elongation factor G, partial [Saprospiraceae bacterium]|nr:elongation factor G [Saprospiraceae bacterium]
GTVEDGSTTSDFTNIEKERQGSIFSTLMHADWRENKINIIDTPGLDDFSGEEISSLKVADTAIILINAKSGVEVGTELVWEYVEKFKKPAIFVINQLDHENAQFENSLDQLKQRFGNKVIPMQYPLNQGPDFNTIVDALRLTMYVFPDDGGKPEKVDIPDSEIGRAQELHNLLVEAAAENDEELMEKFFEEGSLTEEELAKGLTIAISNQEFFPVFCVSATRNMGSGRVMGFINDIAPSPDQLPPTNLADGSELICDANADPTLFIYKTMSEPKIGNVSYFKVCAGTLKSGDELYNDRTSTAERFNQIFTSNGKIRDNVDQLVAGDIGVTVKLKNTHTNDSLGLKGKVKIVEPIHFPEPRIRTAIKPPSKSDLEKVMKALHTIQEEDPTLIVEQSKELKQTILHGQGQLHLDLIKYRLEKANQLQLDFMPPRISYRETITRTANDSYRHKKQSGGSGQFGEVHMRIEPYHEGMAPPSDLTVRNEDVTDLPWGGKLVFLWCIVGGSIDTKYSNAIKKGVMMKMQEGPLTGSPCLDIRVSVYDGKMHPVDSNDMAFQLAATNVFKNAFGQAGPQILEPIHEVEILCSDDVMGDVMGDLQTRRAMIMGMSAEGHYQKIKAKVPLAEMYQYSSTLRSITQGKAKFSRRFSEFMPVTGDLQKQLISEYQEELEEA